MPLNRYIYQYDKYNPTAGQRQSFLPASIDTMVGFIDHLLQQNLSAHYIRRHMTAIAHLHRMSRYPDPTLDPEIKLAMRKVFRLQRH